MQRDAWAQVNLNAVEYNLRLIKSWLNPKTKLMTVVKSDAYGHGASGLSQVLAESGADYFGVASVDEGCQLRQTGIKKPILILSPCPGWALKTAIENNLELTITSALQLDELKEYLTRFKQTATIHIKVDTGMHRLGIQPNKCLDLILKAAEHKQIRVQGLFSHLAMADDQETSFAQNKIFTEVINQVKKAKLAPPLLHLASGEAARRFPELHYDMVRIGLYIYGLEPRTKSADLKPAMSVRARINQIQTLPANEGVGYGHTWESPMESRLASIPIGYADGIDRRLSNNMIGLLHGKPINQVGRISMDQMLFDISKVSQAQEGDVITLIGNDENKRLDLSAWAQELDTITYELACRLRARLPRIYTRENL